MPTNPGVPVRPWNSFAVEALLCADALLREHGPDRRHDDPHVAQEGVVINVLNVEPELLFPAQPIAPGDLGKSGDPRAQLVATGLLWRIAGEVTS